MSWGESNRAVEDEEGEEGSIGGTLKMSRLPTSPVRTHHAVPEARHIGGALSIVTGALSPESRRRSTGPVEPLHRCPRQRLGYVPPAMSGDWPPPNRVPDCGPGPHLRPALPPPARRLCVALFQSRRKLSARPHVRDRVFRQPSPIPLHASYRPAPEGNRRQMVLAGKANSVRPSLKVHRDMLITRIISRRRPSECAEEILVVAGTYGGTH